MNLVEVGMIFLAMISLQCGIMFFYLKYEQENIRDGYFD